MELKLVSKEIAIRLKKLLFYWKCDAFMASTGSFWVDMVKDRYNLNAGELAFPTQALVCKWFRDVHNIFVTPSYDWVGGNGYIVTVGVMDKSSDILDDRYTTYEEAEEAGIIKAIELLNQHKDSINNTFNSDIE